MTGRSNVRNYVHWGILDPSEKTVGHMMKEAGYSTCVAGKWQLHGSGTFVPEKKVLERFRKMQDSMSTFVMILKQITMVIDHPCSLSMA